MPWGIDNGPAIRRARGNVLAAALLEEGWAIVSRSALPPDVPVYGYTAPEPRIPTGGALGDVLTRADDLPFDGRTAWAPPGAMPGDPPLTETDADLLYVRKIGDDLTGALISTALTVAVDPAGTLTTKSYVDALTPADPIGPRTWGRLETGAWQRSVALSGDTMTGPLTIAGTIDSTLIIQAAGTDVAGIQLQPGAFGLELGIVEFGPMLNSGTSWLIGATTYATGRGPGFYMGKETDVGTASLAAFFISDADGHMEVPIIRTTAGDPVGVNDLARKAYVDQIVTQITGGQVLIGVMDASTGLCRFTPTSGYPDGFLPAGSNQGEYILVEISGVTPPEATPPNMTLVHGDWLIADGTDWFRIAVGTESGGGGIPEAPNAGTTVHARRGSDLTWQPAATPADVNLRVLKAGDTMTGDLTLNKIAPTLVLRDTGGTFANLRFANGANTAWDWIGVFSGVSQGMALRRYDAGGNLIDNPILVSSDTGMLRLNPLSFPLTLPGDPTDGLHAATKQYVDGIVAAVEAQIAELRARP
jgi:hypothetical protein